MNSMREVNLDTYSLSLLTAKEDILNPRSSTNWALFAYDGVMNRLKLADSGVGGLKELTSKLQPRRPLYGMCRVEAAQPRIVMILWVGNEVDEYRRAECASHIPAIRAFFKEVHIFLPAHNLDEITEERICSLVNNAGLGSQGSRVRAGRRLDDRHTAVGTNYKRTNAAAEIYRIQRDSFWAQAEREEEERKKEEQQRAAEDRRHRERERLLQEKREATERERRMNEKEQKIKEQRRIQAQTEAEARKQEKKKWKYQEKEREEEERARYSCSGSELKVAEAADLVSQRVENPREFFRQLSSSSLQTASQPKSPLPVRNTYRRLHRSKTDSIFSFAESPSPTPTSPLRPSSYFPSTPTPKSPTVFTKTTASSLHNGAMSPSENQMQISSPTTMDVSVSKAPQLQTPPLPPPKLELKSPISAILDSLVFYPPPPVTVDLQPDEPEIEFPPPPPGFEDSAESSVDETETPDETLMPAFSPPSAFVPEPPSRPLPALPVAPRMLTDLEPERDFSARASVISTVEEEEEEDGEGEMKNEEKDDDGKGGGKEEEELDGMIMEKNKSEKVSIDEFMEKCESEREEDGRILEESEENQVGKPVEELESDKEEDGRRFEEFKGEDKQDGCVVEELVSENRAGGKGETELAGKIMEKNKSEKVSTDEIMKQCESEREGDERILEENEGEDKQDGNILGKCGSEEDQVGKTVDLNIESNKEKDGRRCEEKQDGCIVEELVSETSAGKTVEEFESRIEECNSEEKLDGHIIENEGSEEDQVGETVEEFESNMDLENAKVWRTFEECKGEEKQDKCITEELEREKDRDWETVEEFESRIEEGGICFGECKSEEKLDGKIMKKEDLVGKTVEELENNKEEDWKRSEECKSEEKQDGCIMEELECEKDRAGKTVEEFETGMKYEEKQEENIMEKRPEFGYNEENDKEESRNMVEECESEEKLDGNIEKDENGEVEFGKIVEEFDSEKIQHEFLITENKKDRETVEKHEEEGNSLEESEIETMIEEHEQNILEAFNGEKEQDVNKMDVSETETCMKNIMQFGNMMEERGQENVQYEKELEKWQEEHEREKEVETEKTKVRNIMDEQDQEILKDFKNDQIPNASIILENISAKEHKPEISEAFDNEKEQDGKSTELSEIENIHPKMEECKQDGITVAKCEEENETDKELGSIMEENDYEKVHDWKINKAFDSEKVKDRKNMKVFETETIQHIQNLEGFEHGNEQDRMMVDKCEDDGSLDEHEKEQGREVVGKMMGENAREEKQDGEMVDVSDSEKEQEAFEIEKTQHEKIIKECGQENEQDEKIEHEIPENHEKQNWGMIDDNESENIHYVDIENKIQKEVFETEKKQYVDIMEEYSQEHQEIVEKLQEEHVGEKEQDWKMIQTRDGDDDRRLEQRFENEKTQNAYITENDSTTEKSHENEKSLEDLNSEKEQDGEMMEDNEGEKTQCGDVMENHEREKEQDDVQHNQYYEGTSSMDVDEAVLGKHSYAEIINRDEETEGVKNHAGNETEQIEESGFSQHAPSFPEGLEPSQYNYTSIPGSTANVELNLLIIQVGSDLSNLQDLSVDSDVVSVWPEAEQGLQTETCVTWETEMSDEDETIKSSNDSFEGSDSEAKTSSPVSESQARIGQSDEGEGLVPSVNQFLEESDTAVDINQCINVTPDLTDVEEELEATTHKSTDTDVDHHSKYTADPDPENDKKKHEFLQNCKSITETTQDMRKEKTASEK